MARWLRRPSRTVPMTLSVCCAAIVLVQPAQAPSLKASRWSAKTMTLGQPCFQALGSARLSTANGWHVYVENPRTLKAANGLYLIGLPTLEWHEDSPELTRMIAPGGTPLLGAKLGNDGLVTLLYGPPDGGKIIELRVAADAAGRIHAIWSRSDSGNLDSGALYYAIHNGKRWSPTQKVPQLPPHRWDAGTSELLVTPEGLAVVLPGAPYTSHANSIYLLLRQKSRWITRSITVQANPAYARLAIVGRNITIAYVTADINSPQEADNNSLFSVFSADFNIGSFSSPQLIHRSGRGASHSPIILTNPRGVLFLVWRQTLETSPPRNEVIVATSNDRGRTWSSRPSITQGSSGLLPAAAFSYDGSLLVTSGSATNDSDVLLWWSGAFGRQRFGGPWMSVTSPTLGGVTKDRLLLSFTTTERIAVPAGEQNMPITNIVRIAPCSHQ